MMKIHFKKPHISISSLEPIELPGFMVLTGINGAGKSHLLEAINNKSIIINGTEKNKTILFDYKNFCLDNENIYNMQQINSWKESLWNFFNSNVKSGISASKNNLNNSYEELKNLSNTLNKSFLELLDEDIDNSEHSKKYNEYKKQLENLFKTANQQNYQLAPLIKSISKKIPYSLDEINKDDFFNLIEPYELKNNFLPNQLGKIIWNYYTRYRDNQVNAFINERDGKKYPVLSEIDFIKKYGEKTWELLNKILEKFNTIEYRIFSPEGSNNDKDFQLKLENLDRTISIEFSALSSGEKILMALIASVYKASSDNIFPDILLLDEIDSSLHPSMIKNLLETINDIFLKKGTKVILVTHSPTTVALAPEESIFIMEKYGKNRIIKKSKSEAISILTEGFATLEQGLKLFDQIAKSEISIISEGRNTNYIKKAIELYNLKNVDIVNGLEAISGCTQLNTIYDFFSKIDHKNKVIIVWDCDVSKSRFESKNSYPFYFERNIQNNLVGKGIENLFEEYLFDNFKKQSTDSLGKTTAEFDYKRKMDFEKFILKRNNKQDFINFSPLIDLILRLQRE